MPDAKKLKLSQRPVEAAILAHQPGKRVRHWFAEVPNLYLQITPNGCASYCLRFEKPGGGKGDYTIGQATKITALMAKHAATEHLAKLTLHRIDPCHARKVARADAQSRKLETFACLAEAFMAAPENQRLADRTKRDRRQILDSYLLPRLGKQHVGAITRRSVKEAIRDILASTASHRLNGASDPMAGTRTANKAHEVVRRIFNWAVEEERCTANPAAFPFLFDNNTEKRTGALSDERLKLFWETLAREADSKGGSLSVLAIQLCAVTLQRPVELSKAKLEQFDWNRAVWRIPASCTKTKVEYEVPLSALAVSLFQRAFAMSNSVWAFPAKSGLAPMDPNVFCHRFGKTRRRLHKAGMLNSTDVELYDLRRFGRTQIEHRLGFPRHVAEMAINHAPDRGISSRYDVQGYSNEIRRAHEAWALELTRVVSGTAPAPNVVALPIRLAAE